LLAFSKIKFYLVNCRKFNCCSVGS